MKPIASLLHVAGIIPAQYRNDPATRGIPFSSHARAISPPNPTNPPGVWVELAKGPDLATITDRPTSEELTVEPEYARISIPTLSTLSVHSFVCIVNSVDRLNLGGIYLIYEVDAEKNLYSVYHGEKPTIPRTSLIPVSIYPGMSVYLGEDKTWFGAKSGLYKVKKVGIDDMGCNIAIIVGNDWHYVRDGSLFIPEPRT